MTSFKEFYAKLDTKDEEQNIYTLAKWREKKTRDLSPWKMTIAG